MWYRAFIGILIYLIMGCGTAKKTLVSPAGDLQQSTVKVVTKDTLVVVPLDSTKVVELSANEMDTSVFNSLREPTPEEKVAQQRLTGINKSANWAPAIHYDLRKPNFVIIHHTSQNSVAQTVRTFQVPHSKVSAHYVIGKDGQVIQMLNDYERAWHAGKSKWGTVTDINSVSIGIELDNNGREPFPDSQINSLLVLLDTLKAKYIIPQLNFIGHGDIAPMRKDDPNVFFPWKLLALRGFGIWYNEDYLMEPPANFNPIDALKIMGYDMSNAAGAIRAFKRKYNVKQVDAVLTAHDKAILYDLYRKYY